MDVTGPLTLLMTVIGPLLLGIALVVSSFTRGAAGATLQRSCRPMPPPKISTIGWKTSANAPSAIDQRMHPTVTLGPSGSW
jgi:hypothetical protein